MFTEVCKRLAFFLALAPVLLSADGLLRNSDFSGGLKHWTVFQAPGYRSGGFQAAGGGVTGTYRDILRKKPGGIFFIGQKITLKKNDVYRLDVEAEPGQWTRCTLRYTADLEGKGTPEYERTFYLKKNVKTFSLTFAYGGEELPGGGWFGIDLGNNYAGKITFRKIALEELDYKNLQMPPFKDNWIVFPHAELPADLTKIPESLKDSAGHVIKAQRRHASDMPSVKQKRIDIANGAQTQPRAQAILCQEIYSDSDRKIMIGTAADWWFEFYCNGERLCSTMKNGNGNNVFRPSNHPFQLPLKKGKNVIMIRLLAGSWGWSFFYGIPNAPKPEICFRAGRSWKPVTIPESVIKAGSALDLSALVDKPAGKEGRIKAGENGGFVFEKTNRPIRLQGTHPNFCWRLPWLYDKDRAVFERDVVRWAQAVRRQGYNAIRLSAFSEWSSKIGKAPKYEIPDEALDRLDRLIAELKKEGIYIQFVVMMFHMYNGEIEPSPDSMHYKLMLYMGRSEERERFARFVRKFLNHVNPYTGLAWKDDPAIAIIEPSNEQFYAFRFGDSFLKKKTPEAAFVLKRWREYLAAKYADTEDAGRPAPLRGRKPEQFPGPFTKGLEADFAGFRYQRILETNKFYVQTIRDAGYPGMISNDTLPTLKYLAAEWETFDLGDAHAYYAHPVNGMRDPGSKCLKRSSIGDASPMFRGLNGQRLYGRPFWVGEYNHCFWNPYQYELPLAFTAYAALNRFSALMIHSDAVELKQKGSFIRNFEVADSHVQRAGEFLATMLFQRGDLRPSPSKVVLAIPEDYFRNGIRMQQGISGEQSKLALLTDFSIAFPWLPRPESLPEPQAPSWTIAPSGANAEMKLHDFFVSVSDSGDRKFSLDRAVQEMKRRKLLPQGNRTNAENGIYESSTGEILMQTKLKRISVSTPRTEAVTLLAKGHAETGVLSVDSISADGLVGLTSIDGKPLKESSRMVLVYATRMANSGMKLEGDGETLITIGGSPALMQTGRLSLRIRNGGTGFTCYPLNMDGSRRAAIPLKKDGGALALSVDTAELPEGPTPFFEIVKNN